MALSDLESAGALDLSSVLTDDEALRQIPQSFALGFDVLPLSSNGCELTVAMPDIGDRTTIERLRFATGMHVRAVKAPSSAIRARLASVYQPATGAGRLADRPLDQPPAVAAVEEIEREAAFCIASDIHIEPSECGGRVRLRVDGILRETRRFNEELFAHVVSRIKLLAGMDIADKRQPQDGRYDIECSGESFDARVSSIPTISGEKLAIRLLKQHASAPRLEQLEIPETHLERFRRVSAAPHGFIVAAGPTGSGKTTTAYGILAQRDALSENLCSVEDPIEVRLPGITQVPINPRAGVTFASALRAFLRQDPNVIMVGEMRDQETASVAATASLSGQLVITTLHCNDAPNVVERLAELGVSRQTIAAGLTAVVAQRLVRRLCVECRQGITVDRPLAQEFGVSEDRQLFRASGCPSCLGTGYRGRSAIFELLLVDNAIREAIASGCSAVALLALALRRGFQPMLKHGVTRVLAGETTFEELRRVLAIEMLA